MPDKRRHDDKGVAPPEDGVPIVPSDDDDLESPVRKIVVGTGGDGTQVRLVTVKGTEMVYKNTPSGGSITMGTKKVFETGTTASDLNGEY